MSKNNVKRFSKYEKYGGCGKLSFSICQKFEFAKNFGHEGSKQHQKKWQHKMYRYTNTFSMKNVSVCQYRYISKVSDADTASNTNGLARFEVGF